MASKDRITANMNKDENLQSFLQRAKFSFSSQKLESSRSTTSISGAPSFSATHAGVANVRPSLNLRPNQGPTLVVPSVTIAESGRHRALEEAAHRKVITWSQDSSVLSRQVNTDTPTITITSPSTGTVSPEPRSPASLHSLAFNLHPVDAKFPVPVTRLSHTLRASSFGATMAPGISREELQANGMVYSKFADEPARAEQVQPKRDVNKYTAESLARQDLINKRLADIRAKRDADTTKKDEARRQELLAAEKKAVEELTRRKAEKEAKLASERAEAEAERLEAERLKREEEKARQEQERLEQERLEKERFEQERERKQARLKEKLEALRLATHQAALKKIDKEEEQTLTKLRDQEDGLNNEIDNITINRDRLVTEHEAKKVEVDDAMEILVRLQREEQDLHEAITTADEGLEVLQKKLSELQAESNQITERATNERVRLEAKYHDESKSLEGWSTPLIKATMPDPEVRLFKEHGSTGAPTETSPKSDRASSVTQVSEKAGDPGSKVDESADVDEKPKASAAVETAEGADISKQLTFKAWPKQEARPFGSAPKRLVKLINLPSTWDLIKVQAHVWGGRIEKLQHTPGETAAWALFMRGEDCAKYLDATANGIEIDEGSQKRTIWVEECEPVSVNEYLRGAYNAGVTRCVRAVNVDVDLSSALFHKLATAHNRKIERITSGVSPRGLRVVEFRFANIADASRFKIELQNDIDWEQCNIFYAPDPCEDSTSIHADHN